MAKCFVCNDEIERGDSDQPAYVCQCGIDDSGKDADNDRMRDLIAFRMDWIANGQQWPESGEADA